MCISLLMIHWFTFSGFFSQAFSNFSGVLECSGGLQMAVVWLDKYVSTQLEISTQLASELGHQIGYYLWYLELKWVLNETIWQCLTCTDGKAHHFVAPYHLWPPPLCNQLWYCRQFSQVPFAELVNWKRLHKYNGKRFVSTSLPS